jgi:hypothetical protein
MKSNLRKRLSQTIKGLRQIGKLIGDLEGRYFYFINLHYFQGLCYNNSYSFAEFVNLNKGGGENYV